MRGEIILRGIPASHFSSLKKMFRIFFRLKRDWMLHVRGGLGNVLLVQHSVKYFDRNRQDDLYIYIYIYYFEVWSDTKQISFVKSVLVTDLPEILHTNKKERFKMIILFFLGTWQPYGRSKTDMRNIGGKTQALFSGTKGSAKKCYVCRIPYLLESSFLHSGARVDLLLALVTSHLCACDM